MLSVTTVRSNVYERHITIALGFSLLFHLAIVIAYYTITQKYGSRDEDAVITIKFPRYADIGPPPRIAPDQDFGSSLNPTLVKPQVGVPVPVPEALVSPEQTIATQQEMNSATNPLIDQFGDNTKIEVEQPIRIDENDEPDPREFKAVEKYPAPVQQPRPEYPELARRAGVEGTVFVQILVGRDGKAKKAIVVKSDAEILNEASIAAALRWVFTPAMNSSGPVAVWVTVPFQFRLTR